ncbi:hypothetical protein H920_01034 [Fukomys damarensis]|uniref:Uncharacterized protein n=1 Tax=Fukomys damarensis TaxID=885580 RepID=A0A091DZJ4_FUKDA|nr:hypothetical protein H920_01034 [Fukomys damarensis]
MSEEDSIFHNRRFCCSRPTPGPPGDSQESRIPTHTPFPRGSWVPEPVPVLQALQPPCKSHDLVPWSTAMQFYLGELKSWEHLLVVVISGGEHGPGLDRKRFPDAPVLHTGLGQAGGQSRWRRLDPEGQPSPADIAGHVKGLSHGAWVALQGPSQCYETLVVIAAKDRSRTIAFALHTAPTRALGEPLPAAHPVGSKPQQLRDWAEERSCDRLADLRLCKGSSLRSGVGQFIPHCQESEPVL